LAFDALIADKASTATPLSQNSTRAAPRSSSPSMRAAQSPSPSTRRCTNGGISSGTSSASSKEFKRIAVRADKTDQSFASMIHLTAAVINSR
jgi:hypothetical protein